MFDLKLLKLSVYILKPSLKYLSLKCNLLKKKLKLENKFKHFVKIYYSLSIYCAN